MSLLRIQFTNTLSELQFANASSYCVPCLLVFLDCLLKSRILSLIKSNLLISSFLPSILIPFLSRTIFFCLPSCRSLPLFEKISLYFPGGSDSKVSAYNAGDLGSVPGSGRSPGEGNGKPLRYFCLENPMDGGAWEATVHGVAKSRTQLSDFTSLHFPLSSIPHHHYPFSPSFPCQIFGMYVLYNAPFTYHLVIPENPWKFASIHTTLPELTSGCHQKASYVSIPISRP